MLADKTYLHPATEQPVRGVQILIKRARRFTAVAPGQKRMFDFPIWIAYRYDRCDFLAGI